MTFDLGAPSQIYNVPGYRLSLTCRLSLVLSIIFMTLGAVKGFAQSTSEEISELASEINREIDIIFMPLVSEFSFHKKFLKYEERLRSKEGLDDALKLSPWLMAIEQEQGKDFILDSAFDPKGVCVRVAMLMWADLHPKDVVIEERQELYAGIKINGEFTSQVFCHGPDTDIGSMYSPVYRSDIELIVLNDNAEKVVAELKRMIALGLTL